MPDEEITATTPAAKPRRARPALEAHPDAAIFPMLPDDELAELAADIKANGLLFPIKLTEHGGKDVIVDGRNRAAACEIAGVEPEYEHLDGDPKAFILAANVKRRHMTAGQRAMATAMIYPEAEKGGRGKKSLVTKEFSGERLSKARAVLRYSRPEAERVLAGTFSLDAAYAAVQLAEGRAGAEVGRLRKLRESRPDLAALVDDGSRTLDEAEAKAKEEAEHRKAHRWSATNNLLSALLVLDMDATRAEGFTDNLDPSIAEQAGAEISAARIRRALDFLTAVHDAVLKKEEKVK